MNLRTKIGVVAVLLSTLTVQAQNIPFRKAEIKETMKKVADWQIANPNPVPLVKLSNLTKRLKISPCFSTGMPFPVSETKNRNPFSCSS